VVHIILTKAKLLALYVLKVNIAPMAQSCQCFVLQVLTILLRVKNSKQTVLFVQRIISVQYLASSTIKIRANLLSSMAIYRLLEVNMHRS